MTELLPSMSINSDQVLQVTLNLLVFVDSDMAVVNQVNSGNKRGLREWLSVSKIYLSI